LASDDDNVGMTLDDCLRAIRDIIQVDVGNRGLARDPADNLFNAFPEDFANACRSIAEHQSPRVGIVTGFMIPTVDPPTGETDGPLGALFLASALAHLGVSSVLLSDGSGFAALRAGREFLDLDAKLFELPAAVPPITHLIAIERSGPSRSDGRNYTMRGRDITDLTAPAHLLFEGERDYITIGIGDGGNEIGMGKAPYATIVKNIPRGDLTACRTPTDLLIVAGVSNWGAYALAAGVMLLKRSIESGRFDPAKELKVLEHIVERGPLVDGVAGKPSATVDGLSFAEYAKPLARIADLLRDAAPAD
jgi:D-glutamate cyclase